MDYKVFCVEGVRHGIIDYIYNRKGMMEMAGIYYEKMEEEEFQKLKELRDIKKKELEKLEKKIEKEKHVRITLEAAEILRKKEIARIESMLKESNEKKVFLDFKHENYEEKLRECLREYLGVLEYCY